MEVVRHRYKYYPPRRALDDVSIQGLGLVTAGITAIELEGLTRNVWRRSRIWPDTEVLDIETVDETNEREVVSAVILVNAHEKVDGGLEGKGEQERRERLKYPPSKRCRTENNPPSEATTEDVNLGKLVDISDEEGAVQEAGAVVSFDRTVEAIQPAENEEPLDLTDVFWDFYGSEDDLKGAWGLSMGCPSANVWNRRHWLWSKFDEGIQMDSSAWYELTPECYALKVAENLQMIQAKTNAARQLEAKEPLEADNRPVLAACCGVGGDAIALAQKIPQKIVCVDIDAVKLDMLRNNAEVYGVRDNLELVHADINDYAHDQCSSHITEKVSDHTTVSSMVHKGQVVGTMSFTAKRRIKVRPYAWAVVSPPWGGPDYRMCYSYFMSDQKFCDLIKIIQSCMLIADNLILILPRNQDINELVHLAAHGSPDLERFNYLQIQRMTERSDGYSFLTVAYLSRQQSIPSLFCSDEASIDKLYSSAIAKNIKTLRKVNYPELKTIVAGLKGIRRKPLPSMGVDKTIWTDKLKMDMATAPNGKHKVQELPLSLGHHRLNTVENAVFVKFLLSWLEEPVHQVGGSQYIFDIIGVDQTLNLIAETIRIWRDGGLQKVNSEEKRTKGGVFFTVLKSWFPHAAKEQRKWRRKYMMATSEEPQSSPSEGCTST